MAKFMKRTTKHHKGKKTLKQKVNRLVRQVGIRKPEVKYLDVLFTSTNISNNGSINDITGGIVQGITDNARIGDKIRLLSVMIRGFWQGSSAATSTFNQTCRLMLVKGIGENGNGLGMTTVFPNPVPGNNYVAWSPYNYDKHKSYKVLYDHIVNPAAGWTASIPGFSPRTFFKKHMNLGYNVQYNVATTTVNDGGFYVVMVSDTSNAGNPPNCQFYLRLYFIDC